MRTRAVLAIALLAVTATVTSGCDLLYSMVGPPRADASFPDGSFDPGSSLDPSLDMPVALATYTSGTATIAIDGAAPTKLDILTPGPHLYKDYGLDVMWTDGSGRYLRLIDYSEDGSVTVAVDKIFDGKHWSTWNASAECTVTFSHPADKAGVSGKASCHGLRWSDMMQTGIDAGDEGFVPGEPAFDLEATFSAS